MGQSISNQSACHLYQVAGEGGEEVAREKFIQHTRNFIFLRK